MEIEEYQNRKQDKADRYRELAEKNREKSESYYNGYRSIADNIPMGQPVLVGHHSERRHRRDLERMDNNIRNSIETGKKADYYERKAENLENSRVISSDDPEAVQKLKEKLEKLEKKQDLMKFCNKVIRRKKGTQEEKVKEIMDYTGFQETTILKMFEPDFCGRLGFPAYELQNNNGNMKRIRDRIQSLEKVRNQEDKEYTYKWGSILKNVYENRWQVFFNEIPDIETRTYMKQYGFRWSPSNKAWQCYLTGKGTYGIRTLIKRLNSE